MWAGSPFCIEGSGSHCSSAEIRECSACAHALGEWRKAVSQAVRREGCIARSVETLVSGTNILGLMCACSTGRISAMRETVAVREAPCTPTRARTS